MSSSMKNVCEPGAGRLDDHPLEVEFLFLALVTQIGKDPCQVAAHGATDAAVVHLDDLLLRLGYKQLVVDARGSELVLDHRDAMPVLFAEDAVEQRGLAGAE